MWGEIFIIDLHKLLFLLLVEKFYLIFIISLILWLYIRIFFCCVFLVKRFWRMQSRISYFTWLEQIIYILHLLYFCAIIILLSWRVIQTVLVLWFIFLILISLSKFHSLFDLAFQLLLHDLLMFFDNFLCILSDICGQLCLNNWSNFCLFFNLWFAHHHCSHLDFNYNEI